MDPQFVLVPYSRVFPHPLDAVYEWLTDYQDNDHEHAGAMVERRHVVSREPNRVVLDATIVALGQRARGQAEVRLHPPDRWEARILSGPSKGSVYEYRLTRLGAGRTRLEVVYRIRVKRTWRRIMLTLLSPLIQREIRKMWDGFAAAMARDLAHAGAPLPRT